MPPPASHGSAAAQAYIAAMATGAPQHPGRRVKIDFSQSAHPPDGGRYRGAGGPNYGKPSNDGTRDIGNVQSSVVLLRGLDPVSGLESIAESLKSSEGPGKEGAKGMKRVVLIKDKMTAASLGFAFVEFIDAQVGRFNDPYQQILTYDTVRGGTAWGYDVSPAPPEWFPYLRPTDRIMLCQPCSFPTTTTLYASGRGVHRWVRQLGRTGRCFRQVLG